MRSLSTPRWLVSHVLVVALVVLLVNLGLWQLRRLDERRADNARVAAALAQPVVDVAALAPVAGPRAGLDAGEAVEWRRARATGRYALDEQVLVRSRSLDGRPGSWAVTPLVLDDGTAVAVNRGWVPIGEDGPDGPPPAASAPPDGRVTVTGVLRATEERGRFGPTDPEDGRLASLARLDVGRLDQQVAADLYPVALQLESSDPPPPGDLPVPVPLPDVDDEGPHLSYAVQWFTFATIAAGGYVLILRRQVDEAGKGSRDDRVPEWVT